VLRIACILIFLAAILLQTTLNGVSVKELRRRARSQKDKKAAAVYKLAVLAPSSELFLYLAAALSAAPLVIAAVDYSWWLGLLSLSAGLWLVWVSGRSKPVNGRLFSAAAAIAPLASVPAGVLQPVLRLPAGWLTRHRPVSAGIYEKEDLVDFIKLQRRQPGNRIPDEELKLVIDALGFSGQTVGGVMIPRRKIKWVEGDEAIGPMLMDELHQTGQVRFPVVKEITKSSNPVIIGSLYLNDLLRHLESKGRIRGIMQAGANYINEEQSLREALDGFLKSGNMLLAVVNNFEEVVGVITLEQVLIRLFGGQLQGKFDNYSDIRVIAAGPDSQPAEAKVE
jgi:CBS domain containing-hemolysin-like protein